MVDGIFMIWLMYLGIDFSSLSNWDDVLSTGNIISNHNNLHYHKFYKKKNIFLFIRWFGLKLADTSMNLCE